MIEYKQAIHYNLWRIDVLIVDNSKLQERVGKTTIRK